MTPNFYQTATLKKLWIEATLKKSQVAPYKNLGRLPCKITYQGVVGKWANKNVHNPNKQRGWKNGFSEMILFLCAHLCFLHNVHFSKKPIHVFSPGHVSAQKEFVMTSISKYLRNSEILTHLNTKHKTMSRNKALKNCVGKV